MLASSCCPTFISKSHHVCPSSWAPACALAAREAGRASSLASALSQKRCQTSTTGLRPCQQSLVKRGSQNQELGRMGEVSHQSVSFTNSVEIIGIVREKKQAAHQAKSAVCPRSPTADVFFPVAFQFSSKATSHPPPSWSVLGERPH